MHYEINVSKNGRHYFATHERSLTDYEKAKEVFADICRCFPESEGFCVSISKYETIGTELDWAADKTA